MIANRFFWMVVDFVVYMYIIPLTWLKVVEVGRKARMNNREKMCMIWKKPKITWQKRLRWPSQGGSWCLMDEEPRNLNSIWLFWILKMPGNSTHCTQIDFSSERKMLMTWEEFDEIMPKPLWGQPKVLLQTISHDKSSSVSRTSNSGGTMWFLSCSLTLDKLFIPSRIFMGAGEFVQPIYMCYVDLKKEFDWIP